MPSHASHAHLSLEQVLNESVSHLAPFSAIIFTVALVVIALIRLYVLELIFPKWIWRKSLIKSMSTAQLRSFVNHHVAAGIKIILFPLAGYPLFRIILHDATFHTPYAPGAKVTLGDIMIISNQIFCAMYVFELYYRDAVSIISCLHHVGAIVIAQSAIAMSLNFDHEKDAAIEFLLCFVWGAFDVIAELWPHIAMIYYRVCHEDHRLLYYIFLGVCFIEVSGSVFETIFVMRLFGSLWHRWTLSLKVVTPILHFLFTAAQGWGAWVFWVLARKERKLWLDGRKGSTEEESISPAEVEDKSLGEEEIVPTL